MDMLMGFIWAFLIGGAICLVFQALMMITKLDPPKLLIFGIGLGSLLAAVGFMAFLQQYSFAGVLVMCMGAGDALFGATTMAMSIGNFSLLLLVLAIFVALTIIGIVSGLIYCAVNKGKDAGSSANG